MSVRKDLENIFLAGVERVAPESLIKESLFIKGSLLSIRHFGRDLQYDLSSYKAVYVLGFGKAACPMAAALEEILKEKLTRGIVVTKYGFSSPLKKIKVIEAGHPVPDEESLQAASEISALAEEADDETLVFVLVSGGGSSLLALPAAFGPVPLSLDDKQRTTQLLLESGADIHEVNCVRKHCSGIKGGRLAQKIFPAPFVSLILSDVVGDDLRSIASGPVIGDDSTYAEALSIVERYGLKKRLPSSVSVLLKSGADGRAEETPKSGDPIFRRSKNILLGSNIISLQACCKKALDSGYHAMILSSRITGEAREAARFFYGLGRDAQEHGLLGEKPFCLIAGGETTVTVKGTGQGGRNQEMALAFLEEMRKEGIINPSLFFLSAATDGNDGPTDAAGAFADEEILKAALGNKLQPGDFLRENNAYHFFSESGGLFKTGPTQTNVCDIQILIVT